MKTISIVLPTYNEAENISSMLSALLHMGSTNNYDLKIHVIDDNSPDGTAEIVKEVSKDNNNIHLVNGEKEGLGKAYIRGFKHVLSEHNPEVVVMMDCDFSHDPNAVPSLVESLKSGNDYVIGSRYAGGGAIPGDWPIKRIINSKVANQVATKVGGIDSSIKDISGGFKAIRADALRNVDYEAINTYGYGFQMHLLHLFLSSGYKVSEIPIIFSDRRFGESKMRMSDIIGFLKCAYGLNPKSPVKKLIRFTTVGLIGTFVNLFTLFIMQGVLLLPPIFASIIAVEVSIISNFIMHSKYTFKEAPMTRKGGATRRLVEYNVTSIGTALLTVLVFSVLHGVIGVNYLVAQFLGICASFALNFWVSNKYIWRRHADR